MKKITLLLGLLLGLGWNALAGDRICLITDRPAYIAGDLVYCSAFAIDENGRNSDFSAVAYVELISTEGTLTEAKIGLFNGRGAGAFRIPANAPTGNYRLVAYTARGEADPSGSSLLSIYNTASTARVAGGVEIVPEAAWKAPERAESAPVGGLRLSFPGRLRSGRSATLLVEGPEEAADLVVSVYHEDGLPEGKPLSLSHFLQKSTPGGKGPRAGEYEGEIIYASVEGLDASSGSDNPEHVTAFLSTAGALSNVYVGRPAGDGQLLFYTGNIYGDHELVCEVVSMSGSTCHISLRSPFVHPEPGDIPVLPLSKALRSDLVNRKAALRADTEHPQDTLVTFLPKREDLLLEGIPFLRYHLDDYNRFPTVREICTEFIPELTFSRIKGQWRLRMNVTDATESRHFLQDNILVMMDGVVLTDHSLLADFDALLLEDIDIYRQAVAIGELSFNGVVNFISKKNYVTALQFPENTRVVDFKGVSYPVAYLGEVPSGEDLRQLLFWHPALDLPAGSQLRIPIQAPAYAGRFRIVVQGKRADGSPLHAEYTFEVE